MLTLDCSRHQRHIETRAVGLGPCVLSLTPCLQFVPPALPRLALIRFLFSSRKQLDMQRPMYNKAPAYIEQTYNWSGFYAGVVAGGV